VLVELDAADVSSELSILDAQIVEATARIERLKAERDGSGFQEPNLSEFQHIPSTQVVSGQLHLFNARLLTFKKELEQIDEQIVQGHEQIKGVDAQIEALDLQLSLLKKEIEANKSLEQRGLIVLSTLLEQERSQARLQGERGQLVAQKGQHLSSIAALELNKIRLDSARREKAITELRNLEAEKVELLEDRRIEVRKLERMDIRTPVSGIVFGSQVFALRSVIQPGKEIMYVVPQDQSLIIAAKIPAQDIDQVKFGQSVSLRFTALDQKFTPEVFGTLTKVSADSIVDETTGKAFYEAEVTPLANELTKLGDQSLVPGMPVEAFVRTVDRSPLSYLTKPLMDYFYRAFRDE
jgi:HlyD family secretion protein